MDVAGQRLPLVIPGCLNAGRAKRGIRIIGIGAAIAVFFGVLIIQCHFL